VPAATRAVSWRFLLLVTGVPLLATAIISMSLVALVFIVTSFIGGAFGLSSIIACRHAEAGVLPPGSHVVSDVEFARALHRDAGIAALGLIGLLTVAAFLDFMPLLALWVVLVGVPWSLVVANATFGSYVERMEVRSGLRLVMQWAGMIRYLTARRPVLLLVGENVVPGGVARRR